MTAEFLTIELSRHHPRKRVTQYSRDVSEMRKGRSVLDTPLEPVIGRAFARPGGGVWRL